MPSRASALRSAAPSDATASCRSQAIRGADRRRRGEAGRAAAAQPAAAGEPRSAPRQQAYRVRASFLPGRGERGHRQARRPADARHRACRKARCWRRAASTSRRCSKSWRCPTGLRRDQPEELHRPARRVHPRDRRRRLRLRPDPGGLRRARCTPRSVRRLSRRGAQGLAPVADPLPRRRLRTATGADRAA